MEVKPNGWNIQNAEKKTFWSKILYLAKLCFRNEGESKTFPDNQTSTYPTKKKKKKKAKGSPSGRNDSTWDRNWNSYIGIKNTSKGNYYIGKYKKQYN